LSRSLLSSHRVIVPAIVYYELKRELLRVNKAFGVARLETFASTIPRRYRPLSDEALRLAAELREKARQQGRPTADAKDGCHCNSKHLSQFITAQNRSEILP
jgi:hypothetical protein